MKFAYPSGAKPLEGYTIKRGIGVGGFGEVYFALSDAGKEVALKRIQRNLDVELRGVKQCLNLKHVNLISLWDIRTNEAGESWVVMEYVPGASLRDVIESNPEGVPDQDIKEWFASTCAGVSYLHEKGIVHRDLKPGNIFYDSDQQVIKIGDYGLSKFISCSARSGHTESVGTFHYMAPEIGKGVYGKEIDIYALGIILYEMITGRVPFEGESSQEIIMKHLTADPNLDLVPDEFRQVIRKSLLKDPTLRYRNIPEMLVDLPWQDIAQTGADIIKRNSVGPLVGNDQTGNGQSNGSSVDKLVLTKGKVKPGEIVFGDLRDTNISSSFERAEPIRIVQNAEIIRATNPPPGHLVNANRPTHPPDEPIAKVVHSGAAGIGQWFQNENVSTPFKVVALIAATILVLSNSQWLLPAALAVGLIYLVYYGIWTWTVRMEPEEGLSGKKTKKMSERSKLASDEPLVRRWLGRREFSDRSIELLGSFLIAAVACVVFNLLGVAITGSIFSASIEGWAQFTWMTLTCAVGSWLLLTVGKFWEPYPGDHWSRRILTGLTGLAVGVVAFVLAETLHVDMVQLTETSANPNFPTALVMEGLPLVTAFLVFFTGMFFILRWWKQSDPVRKTRLSIWSVGLCLVWAAVLSHILNVAPLTTCVMAVVISISVQLAAPWLHPEDRRKIGLESVLV